MSFKAGLFYLLIFLAIVLAFLGGQQFLQDQDIYQKTTGRLMPNYIRQGGWQNPDIIKDTVAYLPVTENHLVNWDAAIYDCIRKHGYQLNQQCYDSFKVAFLPGFPLMWRFSGLGLRGISIFNYFIYALALVLALQLTRIPKPQSYGLFVLFLTFPNAIVYGLPYSEALFTIAGLASAWAYIKGRKTLFFFFFFLLVLSRVASLFFVLAVILLAVLYLFHRKRGLRFNKGYWPGLSLLATALAYGVYFIMLWQAGRSPFDYFQATELGNSFFRWPNHFRDWSKEGFSMSSAALAFILIPAFFTGIRLLFIKRQRLMQMSRKAQVAMVAVFYLAGIFCFEALHSGGSLHSLHRIVFCSPAFIFLTLYLWDKMSPLHFVIYFVVAALALGAFWYLVPYTHGQLQPELLGMVLVPLYLLTYFALSRYSRYWLAIPLFLLSLVGVWWATYLHNQFMSNAWIFT